jgi:hypothetical protein
MILYFETEGIVREFYAPCTVADHFTRLKARMSHNRELFLQCACVG